jgi:hypothetical protein
VLYLGRGVLYLGHYSFSGAAASQGQCDDCD